MDFFGSVAVVQVYESCGVLAPALALPCPHLDTSLLALYLALHWRQDVSIIIQALVLDIPHLHYSFLGALYPLSQLLIHCANARAPNQLTHVDHPVEFA
uniref:Uncharacterized protein n=1 Tax=Oryza punctata TaxID=4537 RepID=A0A0E0LGX3_ORYPU